MVKRVNGPIETFYIESAVGKPASADDGSGSPTSKKDIAMLERGSITAMSKQLNEHMYLVVRSLKNNNSKIDYVMQRGDIIKLGRIKFAVKEISIVKEETMEVDEGNQQKIVRHANVESVDDEEFFEFQDVEAYYNMNGGGVTDHEDSIVEQTQSSKVEG